ncbi:MULTISPECIES: glucose-6-phosphate isomerase [unclassified Synechococcus]|uniref:glucose-6-phosphate isomerase n=1 Tax=unclassified Synechococcus TaxID=2626047 RepID=UPI002AD28497|nr:MULTISPECIES: glucose-6-phosphate isomerase [unclassified Synechococcus]MEA5424443.1 glucose-6-phosphate isomerase [Synechococcus sp. CCY9202]CAK6694224.1 Glucose-6-phosphate isomerase [Synechococcus sp. CBW1107]
MSQLPAFNGHDPATQWDRFCALLWHDEALGFWLDVSRMALDQPGLDALRPRFAQAFEAMAALEAGAIANPDEQRMVGHYWLRAPQLAPDAESGAHIASEVDQIETFGRRILAGELMAPCGRPFTDVLWIGIGGSGLGPLLIIRALQEQEAGLPFHFFDNVDPQGMSRTLRALEERLTTTLVIVVSKSGGTPEPRLGMQQARARLESRGGTWAAQAVAVTMQGSQLDRLAEQEGWLQRFDMFDWVGGRTSITSAVGLLPGALAGADIRSFLGGAAAMDEATRVARLESNPAALMAASWYQAGEGHGARDMVVLPYRDRLEVFSRYLQQLVMESLGKQRDRDGLIVNQGIAVYGNKGSTDQHAYVQQLRDGVDNFFVTFIEALDDPADIEPVQGERPGDFLEGFLQGTRSALMEGGRQSMAITLRRFDARALGALIALFERAVGFYAELVNINAYDQPGVEAGKKAAAVILSLQEQLEGRLADGQPRSLAALQNELGSDSPEPLFWILRHLCGNDRGYQADGNWGEPASLVFRRA